ncbi:non-ribosomal peptide synthetase [Streptomyces sp. NPDC001118]
MTIEDKRKVLLERRLRQRSLARSGTRRVDRATRDGLLPLSHQQEDFWFLHQMVEDHTVYNVSFAFRLTGVLDTSRLGRAVAALVVRHEPLRTRFAEQSGVPYQVIDPVPDPAVFRVHECPDLNMTERHAYARAFADEQANKPFDLSTEPLFRCSVVRFSDDDAVLVVAAHHIVTDGWSLTTIFNDLQQLYIRDSPAGHDGLQSLPIQAVDHAVWQKSNLSDEVLSRQVGYWKENLADVSSFVFPADHPRPTEMTWKGALVERRFDQRLGSALQELARSANVSLLAVLLAGFLTVVTRYTEEEDLAVGSILNGRTRPELEPLVGLFATTVVLRTSVAGNPTFKDLVSRCQESVLGALNNQDVPLGRVVEAVNPVRDPSRNPLFQICFSLDTAQTGRLQLALPDVAIEPLELATRQSRLDMTVIVDLDDRGEMGVQIEYNTLIFEESRIKQLAEQLEHVLAQAVAAPTAHITELELLTEAGCSEVLRAGNDTHVNFGSDICLHEWVGDRIGLMSPDAIAVKFGALEMNYAELDMRSNQLAHHLTALGVGPNVLVGVSLKRSLELVVGLLAILKAGGAYIPLDPEMPIQRLKFMLADSGAPVVLTQQLLRDAFEGGPAHPVVLDADWANIVDHYPTTVVETGVTPGDLAYVLYTSGSTGKPKGAMVEHRGIVNWLRSINVILGLQTTDVMIQKASLTFDSSVWEIFGALTNGCKLVLPEPDGHRDRTYLVDLIAAEGVSVLHFVPSTLRHFLADPRAAQLSSIRSIFCGGETLSADLRDELFGKLDVELTNVYGPTETAPTATAWKCPPNDTSATIPIGHMIANMRGYILDGTGRPVPAGAAGELYLAGVGVGRGYLNRPDLTAERFLPDPFGDQPGARMYATGDVVRRRPDGALEFLGRRDTQVKVRGVRIETGEIEFVLRRHPSVADAAVVVRHNTETGEPQIVAYVIPATGEECDEPVLREHASSYLPFYMVPSLFMLLEEFPLTISGKLDHAKLPEPGCRPGGHRQPAATTAEETMAALWASVLGKPARDFDRRDTFFAAGGTSLNLMALISAVRTWSGAELSVRELYSASTLTEMAKLVERRHVSAATDRPQSPVVPIKPTGRRIPFFCVHAVGGSVFPYMRMGELLHPEQPMYGIESLGLGKKPTSVGLTEIAADYVRHVRLVQPAGPYLLGGWSIGGAIAFEMARQLSAEGEETKFVALLDAWVPQGADTLPSLPVRLDSFLHDAAALQNRDPGAIKMQWPSGDSSDEAAIEKLLHVMEEAELVPHGIRGDLRHRIAVFLANQKAYLTHQPAEADLSVTLFSTSQSQSNGIAQEWQKVASGGVTEHLVSGDHYTMLNDENIVSLVNRLQSCLETAQQLSM